MSTPTPWGNSKRAGNLIPFFLLTYLAICLSCVESHPSLACWGIGSCCSCSWCWDYELRTCKVTCRKQLKCSMQVMNVFSSSDVAQFSLEVVMGMFRMGCWQPALVGELFPTYVRWRHAWLPVQAKRLWGEAKVSILKEPWMTRQFLNNWSKNKEI